MQKTLMETRNHSDLSPHKLNQKIYGEINLDDDFIRSVKEKGILVPVLITKDNRIISGNRRWTAAKINNQQVPVHIFPLDDELDIEEAVITANKQREKTTEQKAREFEHLQVIEGERARRLQVEAGKNFGRGQTDPMKDESEKLVENFPQAIVIAKPSTKRQPPARDIAAKKVGMSGKSAVKALEVVKKADELKEAGKEEESEKILETLNNKSVDRAHKEVKKIVASTAIPIKKDKSIFNRTNENIEWAHWSWNPVTGCEHGCKYCYARDIATRFKESYKNGFNPTFYKDRLFAPQNTKIPASGDIGDKSVFVCSMADLFGDWVPQDWIDRVLDSVRKSPKWNFLFLTKNPKRLTSIKWPDNAWVGTTVDIQARVKSAEDAFRNVDAKVKFISCEPLSGELKFNNLEIFDWVIIGARSKNTKFPAMQPKKEWVLSLMNQACNAKCKVYCKPNLKACIKEYPI